MNWAQAVEWVKPYIVRIETRTKAGAEVGTGFLYRRVKNDLLILVTAHHVVKEAATCFLPLTLSDHLSRKCMKLMASERVIFPVKMEGMDSAVIVFTKSEINFPKRPLPTYPASGSIGRVEVGHEAAWLGFPFFPSLPLQRSLCLFSGRVSGGCDIGHGPSYLLDGTGVPGLSGGPVFCCHKIHGLRLLGTVNLLLRTYVEGGIVPGLVRSDNLLLANDVFHSLNKLEEKFIKEIKPKEVSKKLAPFVKKFNTNYGSLSHFPAVYDPPDEPERPSN